MYNIKVIQNELNQYNGKDIINFIINLINREESKEYFLKKLGLYISGYFFIDPFNQNVRELFSEIPFPYTWRKNKLESQSKVINNLFLYWRKKDNIKITDPQKIHLYPEYFYHAPLSEKNYFYFIEEKNVRNYNIHYASYGEILYFSLVWRILIRYAEYYSWTAPLTESSIIKIINYKAKKEIWSFDFFNELRFERERDFSLKLKKDKDLNELFENFSFNDTTILDDLKSLMIIKENNNKYYLYSFKYILNFIERIKSIHRISENYTLYKNIIYEKKDISLELLNQLLLSLVKTFLNLFSANNVAEMYFSLLKNSRFPLIPYFYWLSISKTKIAHLVVPVIDYWSDLFYVPNYNLNNPLNKILAHKIGFCINGIKPIESFENNKNLENGIERKRFNEIIELNKLFNEPIKEKKYVERIRKNEQEIRDQTIRLFRHKCMGYLNYTNKTIRNELSQLDISDKQLIRIKLEFKRLNYYISAIGKLRVSKKNDFDVIKVINNFINNDFKEIYPNFSFDKGRISMVIISGIQNHFTTFIDEFLFNSVKNKHPNRDLAFKLILRDNLEKKMLEFYLEDNGKGIAPEFLPEKIFMRGFSTTGGKGIGLNEIRNSLKNNFNGDIAIISEKNRYTIVKLFIPYKFIKYD
ncbi:MAG: ATP-binding protein [Bacteroidales bacterium]|jgi:signal transduction histidine kinase|nr:ATP-binding protein [Bacteroidales bacterium]